MRTLKTGLLVIVSFLFLENTQTRACSFTSAFSGDTMLCAGTSVNYLSKKVSGHYYRWVLSGGTLISGKGTDSIIVNWPVPGTGSVELVDSTSSCKDSVTKNIYIGLTSAVLTAAAWNVEGSASAPSSGRTYTLTSNVGNQYSAAWNTFQIDLTKNFDFNFTTNQNGGADGMMFVIQNTGNTASPSSVEGSDMGYYDASTGDMDQSIGIEQDLYVSASKFYDSSASHLSLVMDKNEKPLRPQVNISPALGKGSNHKLRVTWNSDIKLFEVYFDGTKEFSWPTDIVKNVFGGSPYVWFGFTGATGGVTSTQTIHADTLIYDQPILTVTKDTLCAGDTAVLTSSSGVAYSWSTGATTKSIKVFKTGAYSVTVTDSSNCKITTTHNIVVMPKITASFSVSNGCTGNNISITNNSSPTSGVTFNWKFGNGDSATGNPPSYKYPGTGSYTISMNATNGGCKATASQPVTIYTHPSGMVVSKSLPFQGQFNTGDVVSPDNICQGDTNTYQFSPPIGYSNSDYGSKWLITSKTFATASGTISTDTVFKNPTPTKNAYFKFFHGKTFADSVLILTVHIKLMPGNCDTVFTRFIQVRPKAVSNFLFANACQGFALSFHDTSTIAAGDAISSWNWDFGDGTTSTLQDPKHTYSKAGAYKVTLTATSNANCGIPLSKTVNEYVKPVAAFHAEAGCVNSGYVFTDSSTITTGSISTHAWTFDDGATSSLKSPTHVYAKSGPFQVKLVITSSVGCKDSVSKSIRVQPTPKAAFIYRNACVGTPVIFTNKSTDTTIGVTGSDTYLWNFGNGNTSTAPSPANTYKANGIYKVKLIATSKYGCIDSAVQKVTPNPETVPNIVYSGACTKNAVAFGDSDANDLGATYSWDFGDNSSFVSYTDATTHTYNTGNTYKVQLILTNGAGCTDTGTASVLISDHPVASFTAPDVCFGKVMTFANKSTPTSGLTYSWNFGDSLSGKNNSSALQNPSHTYSAADSFMVQLAASGSGGCADTLTKTVHVNAVPDAKWNYSVHNQKASFVPSDISQKTYEWHFGTGDSSSSKEPVYPYPPGAHKYDVTLVETNADGCSDTYSDSVTVTGLGISVAGPKNNMNISIYPNPFEGKTTISYTLSNDSKVNVSVYDIEGRLVSQLRNGSFDAGKYQDEFDAVKYNATDGVYLVKMTVNGEVFTGRIVETK